MRAGRSGGRLSFGNHVERGLRPDGSALTGQVEIAPVDSTIVLRIFAAYAGRQSPRSIAKMLNAKGVPGPRGGKWTASLLRNRLYVGERV